MKTIRTFLLMMFMAVTSAAVLAQVPPMLNYQAVLRDAEGHPLVSQDVTIDIAILTADEKSSEVFSETHQVATNAFGLVNLKIGSVNTLEGIDWGNHAFFMEITVDGEVMGASPLLSVPFALHAQSSADAFSGDYEDLTNTPDMSNFIFLEDPQNGDLLYYADGQWNSLGAGEEGQVLGIKNGVPQWVFVDQTIEEVTDADGNVYPVVTIGNQTWMAANLRTTVFDDGTPIAGGLSNADWANTTEPALAVYPHGNVEGINSEEEMFEIYGKLYNYYAVMDAKGLCPAGWRIATRADFDELNMYVAYWGKGFEEKDNAVAGNYLKSCRQIGSPLGGDCNTTEHPRWESNNNHHGTDSFGFTGLPAGRRMADGTFNGIGTRGYWWTSTELSFAMSYWRALWHDGGFAYSGFDYREFGFSVRCILEE